MSNSSKNVSLDKAMLKIVLRKKNIYSINL